MLRLTRERDKLERALGGIKDMGGTPDLMFVIDTNKEAIAIQEATKLGIPVVAIVDSNCNPDGITHPIPGNDDAGRAITLYCDLISRSAIEGISQSQGGMGIDIGEAVEPIPEILPEEAEAAAVADTVAAAAEPEVAEAAAAEPEATEEAVTAELEVEDRYQGLPAPINGKADDLKKISGVGPVLEKKLNELGIFHYSQIAEFSQEDVVRVDETLNFKGRIERDDWIEQARALITEAKN
jgi:small subunit ribosomal protein S2